jgi:hypothetical protein
MLFRSVWLVLILVNGLGCQTPEPPRQAAPQPVVSCAIEEASATADTLSLGHISLTNEAFERLRLPGTLTVDVVHKKSLNDDPAPVRACGGAVVLDASSFGNDGLAKASVRMDGPCAPPPAGSLVKIAAHFHGEGLTRPADCAWVADLPATFGSGGLSGLQQEARLDWLRLAQEKPELAELFSSYLRTFPALVRAIGDPKTERQRTMCDASVKGPSTLYTYGTLIAMAATAPEGETRLEHDEPTFHGARANDEFASELSQAVLSSPTKFIENVSRVDKLRPRMATAPRFLIVVTTRSYQMPSIVEYGKGKKAGTYAPGSFFGDVAVLDLESGTLACEAPFSATGLGTVTDPSAKFLSAISGMARETVKTIAPGITE